MELECPERLMDVLIVSIFKKKKDTNKTHKQNKRASNIVTNSISHSRFSTRAMALRDHVLLYCRVYVLVGLIPITLHQLKVIVPFSN